MENKLKKKTKRIGINEKTERLLWAMSAGRCEKCGRIVYRHLTTKEMGNYAQVAHNFPVGTEGPRAEYKLISPDGDINDVSNLLLLCYDCHRLIDTIEPEKYPPEILQKIKNDFETFVFKATDIKRVVPTLVLKYSPNLHGKRIFVWGAHNALIPEKVIYGEIDLTLKNSQYHVGDPQYWDLEKNNLIRSFESKVVNRVEDFENGYTNISVFAIGPIPLLVKLGELLSNKQSIDVYQLHKNTSSWEWETEGPDTIYTVRYVAECEEPKKIILILSLSGQIRHEEVRSTISWDDALVVEMTPNHKQDSDYLRQKVQLNRFINCYQSLKEDLRKKCSSKVDMHVFAAVPTSVAVEIGRYHNPTVDSPLVIYNYNGGMYSKVLVLGGAHE